MTSIAAGTLAGDRLTRRRQLERKATRSAFDYALGIVWSIGLWFWAIFTAVNVLANVVLARFVLGTVEVGPGGSPQVFLFVMGIITGAGMLSIHVVAGGTRASLVRGWLLAAPVIGAGFAVLTTVLVVVVGRLTTGNPIPSWDAMVGITLGGLVLGTLVWITGISVNAGYRRWGGWRGTLTLPLVLAPVAGAFWGLQRGSTSIETVAQESPLLGWGLGVATSPLGWLIAVAMLAVAGLVMWLLVCRISID